MAYQKALPHTLYLVLKINESRQSIYKKKATFYYEKGMQIPDEFASFFSFKTRRDLAQVNFCNAAVRQFLKSLKNVQRNICDVDHFDKFSFFQN